MNDFLKLGISKQQVDKLAQNGIAKPTPIQERAIPSLLEGKDIIAQAQTGTGKTFAFLLPILEKIVPNTAYIQALIVTPTRELALQITEEVNKLVHDYEGVDVLAVYGGQDVAKQLKKLRNHVQIVVGTPGRLLDHIGRETLLLGEVSFLVLDEADQMLHIGFLNEVEDIIKETPGTRQTMLFSATMPAEIRKLAKKHMREPEYIQVEKKQGPALSVKQQALHMVDRAKQGTLISLIETHRPYLAMIFCRTKRRVSKLYGVLKSHGFSCDELHGDISQAKREQVMKRFRDGEIQLLIATDVAARGLDVEGVTHVFNYDIPQDAESYVHRIGRTGRAGMKGLAITFYSSQDRPTLDLIEKELKIQIPKQNIGNAGNTDSEGTGKRQGTRDRKKPSRPSNRKVTSGSRDRKATSESRDRPGEQSGSRERRGTKQSESKPRRGKASEDNKKREVRRGGNREDFRSKRTEKGPKSSSPSKTTKSKPRSQARNKRKS